MSTWEFVSRRRRWTIERVAVNNGLTTPEQFCAWCDSREIGHPTKEALDSYFVKPVKSVKVEKVEGPEKPKKPTRRKRTSKKTQSAEE
jgi:hypothetical protein